MKHLRSTVLTATLILTGLTFLQSCTTSSSPEGKTICIIGDSYVRNHRRPIEETWHYKASTRMNMTYHNFGRNGACIAFNRDKEGFGPSLLERYRQIPDSTDYILVIAGHNDARKVAGKPDTLALFRQRLDSLCLGLRTYYPKARIGFVTPWDVPQDGFKEINALIHEICKEYRIPVYDAATQSGIAVADSVFRRQYFQGLNDQAHLNDAGHNLMVDKGETFIRSL